MTYATRNDLQEAYGVDEVEQRESALPAGATDRALADADALINSYCAGRYATPLNPMPPNMLRLACAIARYHLLGDAVTERARTDYEDAIAWLKDVAAGRVVLVSVTLSPAPATGGTPTTRTRQRIFGASDIENY